MVQIIALYALLAATFTLAWSVIHYAQPFFFLGMRMVVAGLLIGGYQWWKQESLSIRKRDIWLFLGAIFFHIYLAYITEFWALQYVSGAKTALIYNLSPFVTAILAYFAFGDKLTVKKSLGLAIGFAGFIPLLKANGTFDLIGFISMPELMLLISVVAACIGWIIMKALLDRGYSPLTVNGIAMFWGGILCFITSFFTESWNPAVSDWWPVIWQGGLLILLANVIYYNFYGLLMRRYSVTFLSFVGFLTPLFTALFDWLFFGLTISPAFYITTACVAVGLWLFYTDER